MTPHLSGLDGRCHTLSSQGQLAKTWQSSSSLVLSQLKIPTDVWDAHVAITTIKCRVLEGILEHLAHLK